MDGWPLQLMVVALDGVAVPSGLLDQLHASRSSGVIHLIDAAMLHKGDDGELSMREAPGIQLDDSPYAGRIAGRLFGCDAPGDPAVWSSLPDASEESERRVFGLSADELAEIADAIPRASDVLVLAIEHRWDAGFAETVEMDGGMLLAQGCIGQRTLLDLGNLAGDGAAAPGRECLFGANTSLEE